MDVFESEDSKLRAALVECERLRQENQELRQRLGISSTNAADVQPGEIANAELAVAPVTAKSSADEKVKLFRELFRGREDVYALRWEGRNGKAGYSPAYPRTWGSTFKVDADKPKEYYPLTDNVVVMQGGMGAKQRRAVAEQLRAIPEGEERVVLATGRYIGEGFDDARLDTLFLAMPVSWKGTLQQYVGRLHRLHDNKREVIVFDYVDGAVPVLSKMYSKRVRGYEAVGYVIESDPAFEF